MIGKRGSQRELFDVGNVYDLDLRPSSFHAQLAVAAPRLFKDEDFSALYSDGMGRASVPPSLLALVTILQHEAMVSDEEAIERTAYDLRWAAVLGRVAGKALCAKSTLQLFRAHLIIHEAVRTVFLASIKEAKRSGLLKGKTMRIAADTKPITGRGAVEDTFNLLATGIRQVAAALAKSDKKSAFDWMRDHGFDRYTESSIKGSADIDWSNQQAKDALITEIASDALRVLSMVSLSDTQSHEASELLQKLLMQDIETVSQSGSEEPQCKITRGTTPERIPSATDPEQRHGRKSKSKRFVGSKASICTEVDSGIIVSADVIPANEGDASGVLGMVEQAEENTGMPVVETLGDCAYGSGETRQSFVDEGRTLFAKTPAENDNGGLFPKRAFVIDLETQTVTCPAGHTVSEFSKLPNGHKIFRFGGMCSSCPLRTQCTKSNLGRSVSVHPQEALIREARAYQETQEGRARLRERVGVEHRLARLGQLGIGQARYIGHAKTLFQLMMSSTIANLRRVWNWEGVLAAAKEQALCSSAAIQQAACAVSGVVTGFILHVLSKIMFPVRNRMHVLQSIVAG